MKQQMKTIIKKIFVPMSRISPFECCCIGWMLGGIITERYYSVPLNLAFILVYRIKVWKKWRLFK